MDQRTLFTWLLDQAQITFIHQAIIRSSLKWLITAKHTTPNVQPLWKVCHGRQHQIAAATVRARMLAGRFKTRELEGVFAMNLGNFGTISCLCNEENEENTSRKIQDPGSGRSVCQELRKLWHNLSSVQRRK